MRPSRGVRMIAAMSEYLRIGLIAIVAVIIAKMILPRVPGLSGFAGLI